MTTYKSEQIEFRAGRIVLTEAQWTANTSVYPEGIIAITSDGGNAGKTKVFDGTSYWSQLSYTGGGTGGAVDSVNGQTGTVVVTSDDIANDSVIVGGATVTEAVDALAQNFADNSSAIAALGDVVEEMGGPYKVYVANCAQTGTDAPIATIIMNTLGVVPVWTRENGGEYKATSIGSFTVDKTEVALSSFSSDGSLILFGSSTNVNSVTVTNVEGTDESLFTIRITVYP